MTASSAPLRVLLVEDSIDDAELVSRALRAGGLVIEVRVVATEPELRAALAAFTPEVVISDWLLPGFSGAAAVALVHEWNASVPCILASGTLGEEIVVQALRTGATDYVLKQRLEALTPAVQRALAQGAARREQARLAAELAEANAAIRASEALLRGSLDAMMDPFIICSAIRGEDGAIIGFRTVFANRAAEGFMGRMPDTLTAIPAPAQMGFLGEAPFFDTFRRVVESGEPWSASGVQFTISDPGGGRRGEVNIQIARSGDGFFATWQDVTDRERYRRERENLAAALEQANDGVLVVGVDGIVSYANAAFLESWGLARDDVVGRAADQLGRAVLDPGAHAALFAAARAGVPWRGDVAYPKSDDMHVRLEMSVSPVRDSAATITRYVVTTRDVTALHEANRRLERRRILGAAVAAADRSLLRSSDPGEVVRAACRAIVDTGEIAMAWIGRLDPVTGRIMPTASHGDHGYLAATTRTADGSRLGLGPAGQAVRTAAPAVVNDISASTFLAPWKSAAEQHGYRSLAAVPLRYSDSTTGVLVAYGAQPNAFGPDEVAVLGQLAADTALTLSTIQETERRLDLQVALAASERRFREALYNVAIAAMTLDTRGIVIFANRHLLELTGWEESDAVGQDWFDRFIPPEDRAGERAGYINALKQSRMLPLWRDRLLTRTGTTLQVEWSGAFNRDETGAVTGITCLGNDVTARERARAALEASETRLRTALDTMLEGVTIASAIRDEQGRITDFRVDYANSATATTGGEAGSLQAGRTVLEMFPAHRTNGLFDAYVGVVETGVPFESGAFRYVDPDASGGPLDQVLEHRASKLGDGYVLAVHDITERMGAEEALRESEDRFRTFFTDSVVGTSITELTGEMDLNAAFCAMLGYSPAELRGRPWQAITHEDDIALTEQAESTVLSGKSDAARFTKRYLHKDGSVVWAEIVLTLRRDADGRPLHWMTTALDITARQAAEDEIRRLNAELEERVVERTAKLELANRELETFSYSVSHDLRSPLRAITGFAEILNRRYRDRLDAKGAHFLDNIVEGGRHMGVLIEELLSYSRLGRGQVHVEPVPLGPILDRLRTTFADRIAARGGQLAVSEPLGVPVGDPTLVEQVLVNLLDNALTYRRADVVPLVTVSAVRHNGRIRLAVADNGIGIPAEFQARILEPFVRLHTAEEYPGTGIGLATVRKAARLMDSEVSIVSTPGLGSIFSLDLPAVRGRKVKV